MACRIVKKNCKKNFKKKIATWKPGDNFQNQVTP